MQSGGGARPSPTAPDRSFSNRSQFSNRSHVTPTSDMTTMNHMNDEALKPP